MEFVSPHGMQSICIDGAFVPNTRILRPPFEVTQELLERFYRGVDKTSSADGCWQFTRSVSSKGYAKFSLDGVIYDAHVMAWRIANDGQPVPVGSAICHLCDNPRCVNPKHLELGNQQINAIHKTGAFKGEFTGRKSPSSCLNATIVQQIRTLAQDGEKPEDIAFLTSVSVTCVNGIVSKRTWLHVPYRKVQVDHLYAAKFKAAR